MLTNLLDVLDVELSVNVVESSDPSIWSRSLVLASLVCTESGTVIVEPVQPLSELDHLNSSIQPSISPAAASDMSPPIFSIPAMFAGSPLLTALVNT